mmetsp:Transcript_29305/g.77919  ORF Transcript_29305/g.77919 Transcript_29305/m.77919 type:complete len:221 (-) Transcript_29305:411-1073(-)
MCGSLALWFKVSWLSLVASVRDDPGAVDSWRHRFRRDQQRGPTSGATVHLQLVCHLLGSSPQHGDRHRRRLLPAGKGAVPQDGGRAEAGRRAGHSPALPALQHALLGAPEDPLAPQWPRGSAGRLARGLAGAGGAAGGRGPPAALAAPARGRRGRRGGGGRGGALPPLRRLPEGGPHVHQPSLRRRRAAAGGAAPGRDHRGPHRPRGRRRRAPAGAARRL